MKALLVTTIAFLFVTLSYSQNFDPEQYYGISDVYKTNILKEDFDNSFNGWNLPYNKQKIFVISDGVLDMVNYSTSNSSTTNIELPMNKNRDFEIEAKIKHVKGDDIRGHAILWGISNEPTYTDFGFMFSNDGSFEVTQYANGQYKKLIDWTRITSYKPNQYNILTIRKVGEKYYFFINKKLVGQISNINLKGNRIGFEVGKYSEIKVDYLYVRYIDTPPNYMSGTGGNQHKTNKTEADYYGIENSRLKTIFTENFFDNSKGWAIVEGNPDYSMTIKYGYYELKSTSNSFFSTKLSLPFQLSNYENYQIEAGILALGDQGYENCLMWGVDKQKQSFRFGITPNGYYTIYKFDKNGIHDYIDYTESPDIQNAMFNMLTIRKYNDKFYFFINQKLVFTHDTEPLYGNYIGFLVGKYCTVKIDYLYIWQID